MIKKLLSTSVWFFLVLLKFYFLITGHDKVVIFMTLMASKCFLIPFPELSGPISVNLHDRQEFAFRKVQICMRLIYQSTELHFRLRHLWAIV